MAARSPNVSFSRAVELLNAGDVAQAEQICRDLVARNRRDHRALAVLGQIATMTSRHDEAAKLLGQCVSLAPRDVGLLLEGRNDSLIIKHSAGEDNLIAELSIAYHLGEIVFCDGVGKASGNYLQRYAFLLG